ncbi:MAG: hypothetical protein WD690_08340 [Vicinamibacterales bacterium]
MNNFGWGRLPVARIKLTVAAWAMMAGLAGAQETVSISIPPAVSFMVTDVARVTSGAPNPTTLSFSSASLDAGKVLRISVQADASAFTPPGGAAIPAANVSWSILGAAGGVGSSGTLSATSFGLVYQSNPNTASGHVDLAWSLAAPGGGIRAGRHDLTIHWKLESITP